MYAFFYLHFKPGAQLVRFLWKRGFGTFCLKLKQVEWVSILREGRVPHRYMGNCTAWVVSDLIVCVACMFKGRIH